MVVLGVTTLLSTSKWTDQAFRTPQTLLCKEINQGFPLLWTYNYKFYHRTTWAFHLLHLLMI